MTFSEHRRATLVLLITALLALALCGPARAQDLGYCRAGSWERCAIDNGPWLMGALGVAILLYAAWHGLRRVAAWWTES
jgi:hypothetical protein